MFYEVYVLGEELLLYDFDVMVMYTLNVVPLFN